MAGFVEQATLRVNDQSSAAIRKINAELKKLDQTARSLKNIRVNITINDRGVQQAITNLRSLQRQLHTMGATRINLNVNATGITQAAQQINRLRQQAAQPINVNTRGAGGPGGPGGAGAGRRGLRQTGIQYQMGNFSPLRGAASVVIGGTAYAVAANIARTALEGVVGSEDARIRLRQSGFDDKQVDYFMAAARKNQEEFGRIPAAEIANAAVEQLNAIKANQGTFAQYEAAMKRIASNAQIMSMTFKDPAKGAQNARQLERLSQNLGQDVDETKIKQIHEAAMRAVIATGGEMTIEEMVRVTQQLGSSIAKTMSPDALLDIFMIREEGGRASTAEWRTAIQDLSRGSINKKDRALMTKHGLRDKSGKSIPAVANAAATNLVKFTEDYIRPILQKAGKDLASSQEIAAYLDEEAGFSTSSARAYADIITSRNNKDYQRQRAAAGYVNLDPHLGDKTFRGGSERLKASFETALARALDKTGPAFTEAITPFAVAMDKAGKAAEKSDYAGAAFEMTKGVANLMGGPAGAILTTLSAASAIRTLLDPSASPMEKAAALLVTGSTALLTAAGAIASYFGEKDPNKDLAHQQMLEKQLPERLANLREQEKKAEAAVTADPTVRNKQRLADIRRVIAADEIALRDVQRNIIDAQARVDAANAEVARLKAEEEAHLERMRKESGLGQPGTAAVPTTTDGKPLIPTEAVKALQQVGAGRLAGVKSVTDLMKAMNLPSSIAAREALAKQLGYTGRLGGSAAMNTFLLNYFRKLAAEPPKPEVVKPPEEPVVKPPEEPTVIEQPVKVTPEPTTAPGTTAPPAKQPSAPQPLGAPRPLGEIIDLDAAKVQFASFFTSGSATIGQSGTTVGSNAAGTLEGRAGGIGAAIGDAAASRISQATVNIQIPNMPSPSPPASTGPQNV